MDPKKEPPKGKQPAKPDAGKAAGKPDPKKNAGKDKQDATKNKEAKGAAAQPGPESKQPPNGKEPPKESNVGQNIMVITLLWCYEVLYLIVEAVKARFFYANPEELNRKITVDIKPNTFSSRTVMVTTILLTLAVGAKSMGKMKFGAMLIGLSIYILIPILGIVLSNVFVRGLLETMVWLTVAWHAVEPLKYWLVFNQIVPITGTLSRTIVTLNALVIGFIRYIVNVLKTPSWFTSLEYTILWSCIVLSMIVWLVVIFLMKKMMTKVEDSGDSIETIYKEAGAQESYNAKQTYKHFLIFVLILCPSIAFSLSQATVAMKSEIDAKNDWIHATYRIDLLVSLVSMVAVTCLIISLQEIRHETKDVLAISLAHYFNFIFFVLYFGQAISYIDKHQLTARESAARIGQSGLHEIFVLHPDSMYANTNFQYEGKPVEKLSDYLHLHIVEYKGTNSHITATQPNGAQLFSYRTDFQEQYKFLYLHKGKLYPFGIKSFRQPEVPTDRTVWIASGLEPCNNGPSQDEYGNTLYMFGNGSCQALKVKASFKAKNGTHLGQVLLRVPLLGDDFLQPSHFPRDATNYNVEFYVGDSKVNESHAEHIEQADGRPPYALLVIWVDSSDGKFHQKEINWDARYGKTFHVSREDEGEIDEGEIDEGSSIWSNGVIDWFAMICCGIANGIAIVCYWNLIWIQCPWTGRGGMIAFFLVINYFGHWYVRNHYTGWQVGDYLYPLVIQMICLLWHTMAITSLCGNIRKLLPSEEKQENDILY